MRAIAPLSFGERQRQVEGMMDRGAAFGRVEEEIDAADLPHDHKAALWLLAWSLRTPALQRQDARLALGVVEAGG